MTSNNTFTLHCPAKINLSLLVGEKRSDGFHEIGSLMQTVDLFDEIKLKRMNKFTGKRIFLSNDKTLKWDENNLIFKAVKSIENLTGEIFPFDIELKKSIPSCGGLGGGSSDAAFILRFSKFFYKLSAKEIFSIALSLGSDIPFFLYSGTCIIFGRGERIIIKEDLVKYCVEIILPASKVSTETAFNYIDKNKISDKIDKENLFTLYKLLKKCNLENVKNYSENTFERFLLSKDNEIKLKYKEATGKNGLFTRISGSGSTVFTVFKDNCSKNFFVGSEEVYNLNEYRWISASQNIIES